MPINIQYSVSSIQKGLFKNWTGVAFCLLFFFFALGGAQCANIEERECSISASSSRLSGNDFGESAFPVAENFHSLNSHFRSKAPSGKYVEYDTCWEYFCGIYCCHCCVSCWKTFCSSCGDFFRDCCYLSSCWERFWSSCRRGNQLPPPAYDDTSFTRDESGFVRFSTPGPDSETMEQRVGTSVSSSPQSPPAFAGVITS